MFVLLCGGSLTAQTSGDLDGILPLKPRAPSSFHWVHLFLFHIRLAPPATQFGHSPAAQEHAPSYLCYLREEHLVHQLFLLSASPSQLPDISHFFAFPMPLVQTTTISNLRYCHYCRNFLAQLCFPPDFSLRISITARIDFKSAMSYL